jgi:hypothetical protein
MYKPIIATLSSVGYKTNEIYCVDSHIQFEI